VGRVATLEREVEILKVLGGESAYKKGDDGDTL